MCYYAVTMMILAIETSCDETAAAVVRDGTIIISNIIASSAAMHEKTGGIIPEMAAREQIRCILPVIEEALQQKTYNKQHRTKTIKKKMLSVLCSMLYDIDAIAVTVGPGLIGSLLVGVETAKTIAYVSQKPVIPVNHVIAHIYANFLREQKTENRKQIEFSAVALVVSGGHTELFLMKDERKLQWLGGTLDDASGEAFDKTARLLGLGFPGGPAIAAAAAKIRNPIRQPADEIRIRLPRPMIGSDDLNFSFSGLKTAVLREVSKLKASNQLNCETIKQISYEIQEAITDVLVAKTIKAAKKYNVKSILLGGGVAANLRLREKFNLQLTTNNLQLICPPPILCTDNAAYIASYAYFHNNPVPWKNIQAQPDISVEVTPT